MTGFFSELDIATTGVTDVTKLFSLATNFSCFSLTEILKLRGQKKLTILKVKPSFSMPHTFFGPEENVHQIINK